MKIEQSLDRIHTAVTRIVFLQLFTAFTRILLGIGFIYPSIPKIMGRPFTSLPDSHPVGHYFNALLQTGYYYQFIGWAQLTAAVLLLIPRTSHLGAMMFFPIILNITVLTNSVGFKGTWLVTIFMSVAALYLVCWDYDRWKTILFRGRTQRSNILRYELIWLPLLSATGVVAAYLLLAFYLLNIVSKINFGFLGILSIAGFIFGFLVALHHKFMRIGEADVSGKLL